jgi:aspartyl/asparaginyl beta-hydroxylase
VITGKYFTCFNSGLDTRPLLKAIEAKPDLWNQITARQTTPGSPHADTRCIFLRWSPAQTIEAVFNDIEAIDYPAYSELEEARAIVATTVKLTRATTLGRVIITNLKPGGKISPHADEGFYADTYERFHFVLKSDFGNRFYVSGPQTEEVCAMKPGQIWWFDHKRTHWVENTSNTDRIHLIMDMVAPDFRVEREQ